jgi:hypothetical protein
VVFGEHLQQYDIGIDWYQADVKCDIGIDWYQADGLHVK